MRDEFVDVFEQEELSNRVEKEVLPLPIIVTLADESTKSILLELLKGRITEEKIERIIDVAIGSSASLLLVSEMKQMVEKLKIKTRSLRYCKEELDLTLTATIEDL